MKTKNISSLPHPTSPSQGEEQRISPLTKGRLRGVLWFTLVELIVVITILVILGTIAFTSLSGFSGSARDSDRITTLKNLESGLSLYQIKAGTYPLPEDIYGTGTVNGVSLVYVWYAKDRISRFAQMNKTPIDPLSKDFYVYGTDITQQYYQIATTLESPVAYHSPNIAYHSPSIPFTSLISTASADTAYADTVYQAKVMGNYRGILKTTSMVYNLPSLLFTGSGNLLSTGSYFVVDKSQNLPYKLDTTTSGTTQTAAQVFTLLGSSVTTLTGITLPTDKTAFLAQSGTYQTALGYPVDSIGMVIFGSAYLGSTNVSGGGTTPTTTTFSLSATSVTAGTSVTLSDACTTHPTSYTSSNTSVATVSSTTITTLAAGTTTITPVGGNCTDSAGKALTVTAAPIPAYSSASSTAAYTAGMQFTYSGVTVTVTTAGIGTGSSIYSGCDTPDIVIWASGYNPQIWAACNVGATTSAGFASVPAQSPNPTATSTATPPDRVAAVQWNYYQWGRNDNVTTGTYTAWVTGHVSSGEFSNGTTSNTNFYAGDASYGEWYFPDINVTASNRWVTTPQWPCAAGYHVPSDGATASATDWRMASQLIIGNDTPSGTQYDTVRSTLKLPLSGYRYWNNGQYYYQGMTAYYWSSSPVTPTAYLAYFSAGGGNIASNSNRAHGFSVRCLKN